MYRKSIKGIFAALCMLLLILDSKTAISGASDGISLCIQVLIPSLFPFFVISALLTSFLTGASSTILHPIGKAMRIPAGTESLFLIGILGGYPVGAQAVCQANKGGFLQKNDAARMMGFCSNAGPAFLFGVIASQFPDRKYVWLIWGVLLLSAFITALLLPGGNCKHVSIHKSEEYTLSQALEKSLRIMAGVCGWVVIFRVIIGFLDRWFLWMLPEIFKIGIHMLLELGNGCTNLIYIDNVALRFVVCTAGLSFGGLCVLFQTISVAGNTGIGLYLPGKLIQTLVCTLITVIISVAISYGFTLQFLLTILLITILITATLSYCCKKHQKNCGNIIPTVV